MPTRRNRCLPWDSINFMARRPLRPARERPWTTIVAAAGGGAGRARRNGFLRRNRLMRSLLAFAVAAALAAPLAASAADTPAPVKPLRQLVYDVTYTPHPTHEVKSSGFNSGYSGGGGRGFPPGRRT